MSPLPDSITINQFSLPTTSANPTSSTTTTSTATSTTVLNNALRLLRPHLPTALPLYRRLQFGRFFDATRLLTNLPLDSTVAAEIGAAAPWFIAFVDRSTRPETEVWFYGSWEDQIDNTTSSPSVSIEQQQSDIDALLRALILELKSLGLPPSIHQDVVDARSAAAAEGEDKDSSGLSRKDYGGHAADPNIMLWGAVHERTVPIIERLGVLSYKFKTSLVPNFTFIWDLDALAAAKELPEGLRWGELRREDFALVRSRTQIPRQERTMAVLPNLAIFPANGGEEAVRPVSWAFVGLDGSLTTLHVEAEWRGRGLAKAITTKLFREKMERFWEEGMPRWAHGYVIVGNKQSEGMCRSLGGKSGWESFWLRLDLEAV